MGRRCFGGSGNGLSHELPTAKAAAEIVHQTPCRFRVETEGTLVRRPMKLPPDWDSSAHVTHPWEQLDCVFRGNHASCSHAAAPLKTGSRSPSCNRSHDQTIHSCEKHTRNQTSSITIKVADFVSDGPTCNAGQRHIY